LALCPSLGQASWPARFGAIESGCSSLVAKSALAMRDIEACFNIE
jgi:hypothetical protein